MEYSVGNSIKQWTELKNRIEKDLVSIDHTTQGIVIVNVVVSDCVENLIFFFPISDMARSFKLKSELNITIDKSIPDPKEMEQKAKHFLFIQQLFRKSVKIRINGSANRVQQTRFGRLQPLFAVTNQDSPFCYKRLFQNDSNFSDFDDVLETFINTTILGRSLSSDKKKDLKDFITNKSNYYGKDFLKDNELYFSSDSNENIRWGKLFNINTNDDMYRVYSKIAMSNLIYSLQTIAGIQKVVNYSKTDKESFAKALIRDISEIINDLPILTQYIWSLLLRVQIESKIMIVHEESEKTYYKSIFDTTLIQAEALADGIYQLIENACLHAKSHSGYFYIRIHQTEISLGASSSDDYQTIEKNIQVLKLLSEAYKPLQVSGKNKCYLEIIFVDNAFDPKGMCGMIDNFNMMHRKKIHNLKELFWRIPEETDDLIVHYGLRVFERTVRMNNGAFLVDTPIAGSENEGTSYRSIPEKEGDAFKKDIQYYHGTVYRILLPIDEAFHISRSLKEDCTSTASLFDTAFIRTTLTPYRFTVGTDSDFDTYEKKKDNVEWINLQIVQETNKIKDRDKRIICINLENYALNYIELFAKALIKFLLDNRRKRNYLALLFNNKHQIVEFVRTYTAFFDRSGLNYSSFCLEDTQIALCLKRFDRFNVCFILSGNDLFTAMQTIRNYLYYHADTSIDFFPVISYLTGFIETKNRETSIKPVFPFDCYLDLISFDEYNNDQGSINYSNTWFFRRIDQILETDMQTNGYGCKISNVHVSLGSKIHTDTFYNAELIFHNYANVFRFAYFVARDIINEHYSVEQPSRKIVLVAYGEYSLLLIQKICDIINSYDPELHSDYILFPSYLSEEEQRSWQTQGKEFEVFIESEKIERTHGLKDYIFYIVVPISTTLTTVKKIKDTLKRKCKHENITDVPEFGISTSIIVSGGIENSKGTSMGYWSAVQKEHRLIFIDDYSRVRYYFNKEAEWYRASSEEGCILCKSIAGVRRKSLIGVDKTSTLPSAIFDTLDRVKGAFPTERDNDKRIRRLYGRIRYSHITDEQNHYLYDIDYEKYCRDKTVRRDISDWIKRKVYPEIDHNAFNIVVSPLDSENSVFLKEVLENAFESSSRVINIKFHTAYRDEIRSKLEFVSEEYRMLTKSINSISINVYFVDDCIIEGSTFQRSKQFLYMLLSESGLSMDRVSLYHGIILLSNRSSYETIHNLLGKRLEGNFFSYLRLNVPSFNTNNRICPACGLAEQYTLMKKRTSTNIIAAEYQRLFLKHEPKTRLQYEKWLEKLLLKDNYFSKLKTWLYYSVFYNKGSKEYYYTDIEGTAIPLSSDSTCFAPLMKDGLLDQLMSGREMLTKEKLDDGITGEKAVVKLLKTGFLANKDYCRMICTHEIFTTSEEYHNETAVFSPNAEDYEEGLRVAILDIIKRRLDNIDAVSKTLPKKTVLWLKAEWIISYIKIISRKQPAQYYHLRNTIYNILIDFIDAITRKRCIDDIKFITDLCVLSENQHCENSVMPDMKFRIFLTAIRRLSAMHSSYLIENIDSAFTYYHQCYEQYKGNGAFCSFFNGSEKYRETYHSLVEYPDESLFNLNIAKLTKWSSMYGVDDNKCFWVEKLFSEKLGSSDAIKLAYLENTQVIYSGVKKLVLDYKMTWDNLDDKDSVTHFVSSILAKEKELICSNLNGMSLYKSFLDFENYPIIMNDREKTEKFSKRLVGMMIMFDTLCKLESEITSIQDPYDYVHLCNNIRDITGYWQCKIISYREHSVSVITSSDIHKSYFMNDLKEKEMDFILSRFCSRILGDYQLSSVAQKFIVGKKAEGEDNFELMIVPLLTQQIKIDTQYLPKYYMILYKEKVSDSAIDDGTILNPELTKQDLQNLRNVLFLRDRLEFVLSRDISELYGMITSYDYVKPLVKDRKPVILHISDLHIRATISRMSSFHIPDSIVKIIKNEAKKLKPDLLLITGDVVNGNYSAAGLQNAYDNAIIVIKYIARVLWRDKNRKYVRSDWNKRILISTGNHDYASMNELEAKNKKRSTTSGKPGALGDVMIKHSYFINFIHRLLGSDIDDIIEYDLNQTINYQKLGISVVNINTNSDVNPYRTNKVKINADVIRRMVSNVSLQNRIVYMMHHTLIYYLDYIDDIYYLKLNSKELIELEKTITKAFSDWGIPYPKRNINGIWIDLIRSLGSNFSKPLYNLDKDQQIVLMHRFIDTDCMEKTDLDDFSYFLSCDNPECDDRCISIMFELKGLDYATQKDTEKYVKFLKEHFGKLKESAEDSLYIILGGHTHKAEYCLDSIPGDMSNCLGIFEAGQCFAERSEKIEWSYNIITVNDPVGYECKGSLSPIKRTSSYGMLEKINAEKRKDDSIL